MNEERTSVNIIPAPPDSPMERSLHPSIPPQGSILHQQGREDGTHSQQKKGWGKSNITPLPSIFHGINLHCHQTLIYPPPFPRDLFVPWEPWAGRCSHLSGEELPAQPGAQQTLPTLAFGPSVITGEQKNPGVLHLHTPTIANMQSRTSKKQILCPKKLIIWPRDFPRERELVGTSPEVLQVS